MIFGILTLIYIWVEIYYTRYKDRIYRKFGNFDIKKYDILFYLMKFIYPIWIIFGIIRNPLLFTLIITTHIIPFFKPYDKLFLARYSLVAPYIRLLLFSISLLASLL